MSPASGPTGPRCGLPTQVDDKLYAFTSATKARDSSEDFDTLTGVTNVWDIWSDGATMWVLDANDFEISAFNLRTKARESGEDFTTLAAAGNTSLQAASGRTAKRCG